ncbi:hypothetical protein Slala04_12390 [Streptomyces lavendulae subsp. lavendulae]|nr:hypothetical protein Slala04_12390 [Streptomyces lavendulae subsp. lavendulae]
MNAPRVNAVNDQHKTRFPTLEPPPCTPLPRAPRQPHTATAASTPASPRSPPTPAAKDETLTKVTMLPTPAEQPHPPGAIT